MSTSIRAQRFAVCQLGGRMHYAVARSLYEVGALDSFHTDAYLSAAWMSRLARLPRSCMPAGLKRLQSRGTPLPDDVVSAYPAFGLTYYLRTRRAVDAEQLSRVFLWAGQTFGARVLRHGLGQASAVYTFNTAALEILEAARQRGLSTVVEQTIVPRAIEEQLLAAEQTRHPGWETAPRAGRAGAATAEREAREWALADLIVCGSEFVRSGIRQLGGPVDRCVVVPYGVDMPASPTRLAAGRQPLRVLLVGHVSLRKGAPYALAAAKALKNVAQFRWVGPVMIQDHAAIALSKHIDLIGTVPRGDVSAHYRWADVLLLPSACEGSATVTYEALASGVPVVTTVAAGSPVRSGTDGFVVGSGDADAMIDALRQLVEHRSALSEMSLAAMSGASRLTSNAYKARLLPMLLDSTEAKERLA